MIKTTKEINFTQLTEELGGRGLLAEWDENEKTISSAEGDITDGELQAAIDSHIAQPIPQPTVAEKLASVGLHLDDLKEALGL